MNNGKLWVVEGKIGLTPEYLTSLGVLWNIVPKRGVVKKGSEVKAGEVFCNVESNRCLVPLRCPVDGNVVEWNETLLENPQDFTTQTWIVRLKEKQ